MSIDKRTGDRKPHPLLGKTVKDTRLVRFVDLNSYTDKIVEFLRGGIVKVTESEYTVAGGDNIIYTSVDSTITLDKALEEKRITIKNGENVTTTILAADGDTIEGQDSITLTQSNSSVQLVAIDDTRWIII